MIDYRLKDLFWQSSVDHQLKLEFSGGDVITNEDIYSESMEITESLCSEQELHFGACESSQFKIRIANSFTSHIGQTVKVSMTLGGDTENPFVFGTYKVQSDKATADRRYRDITAYDAMYDILNADVTEWYNAMFPNTDSKMTLREFRNAFLEHLGVEYEDVLLANDFMNVGRTITTENESKLTGKKVINAICEINGCFGHINRDGIFTFVRLKPLSQALYPSHDLFPDHDVFPATEGNLTKIENNNYRSCQFEDFSSALITQLQVRMEENDIGCVYPNDKDNTNSYVVQGNFLVYGKSASDLEKLSKNLFEQIKVVSYRPCTLVAMSNPCFEVGDGFRIYSRYKEIKSYILSRSIKGIQALTDTFTNNGTEYFSQRANGVNEQISSLVGRTNKLVRTVEEMTSEISETRTYAGKVATDAENNANKHTDDALKQYSTTEQMNTAIKQTADNINLTVEKTVTEVQEVRETVENVDNFTQTLQNSIEDIQNQIDGVVDTYYLKGEPTLDNEPAVNWTKDSEKDKHIGDTYYDRETGYAYRFIKDGNNYIWERIVDSDAIKALEMASKAQDTADGKRRVFSVTPTPPYDVGDLWSQGANGDLMKCIVAKASGQIYSLNDWDLATKYTDDTKVNRLANNLSTNYYNKTAIDQENDRILASVEEKITQGDNEVLTDTKAEIELLPHTISLGVTNFEKDTQASISLSVLDKNGKPIESGEPAIINLKGLVTFSSMESGSETTTIRGADILSGVIQSNNYKKDVSGIKIDLNNETIDMPNFKLTSKGNLTANNANIGGNLHCNGKLYLGADLYGTNPIEWALFSFSNKESDINILKMNGYDGNRIIEYENVASGYCAFGSSKVSTSLRGNRVSVIGNTTFADKVIFTSSVQVNSSINTNQNIASQKNIGIGVGNYENGATLYTRWADGNIHNIIDCDETGITTFFGWSGKNNGTHVRDTYTILRGTNIQLKKVGGTTVDSDERLKNNFGSMSKYEEFFEKLKPLSYHYKLGTGGRSHLGFKAQEVEDALSQSGLSNLDFGGIVKSPYIVDKEDVEEQKLMKSLGINAGDDVYGLIYTEFIALNTYMIQKLVKRVDRLEEQLNGKTNNN